MLDSYAIFTHHAIDRLRECQLPLEKASYLLYTATRDELPSDMKRYKASKYKEHALHYRNGTVLFTVVPKVSKYNGDKIYVVLSVFDQRISLR